MGSGAEPQPKSNVVHFYVQNLTASGNDPNDFPENQLAKFKTGYKNINAFHDFYDRLTWKYILQLNYWRGPIYAWPL